MAQARLSMRKLKEIARLRYEAGRSYSEIAAAAGVARSTVQVTLARLSKAGVSWPWPDDLDKAALEAKLYERPGQSEAWRATRHAGASLPDFARMRAELGRKGVTRRLLWQEYRQQHPQGLEYSQFCELYRRWAKTQDVVMRFEHAPGDKLFVDYAGLTVAIIDRRTGEAHPAQIFVATLGTPATPTSRPRQASKRRRGWPATCGPSSSSAGCRKRSCSIT